MLPRRMPTITALACTNGDVGYGKPCWKFSFGWCVMHLCWHLFGVFEFSSLDDVAQSRCSKVGWCILKTGVLLWNIWQLIYTRMLMQGHFFLRKQTLAPKEWLRLFRICGVRPRVSWRPHLTWMWDVRTSNCEAEFGIWIVMNKNPQCVHCLWKWRRALWMARRWHEIDMLRRAWFNSGEKVSSEKNRIVGEGRIDNHHADCDIQYQRIATSLGAATHLTLLPRFSWFGHHLLPGAHFTSLALV